MRERPRTLGSELSNEALDYLVGLLRLSRFTGNHLEIGTAAGGTLVKIMGCYSEQARPHFVVIDTMTYFANQHEIVMSNVKENGFDPHSVEFRIGRSYDLLPEAERRSEQYDFILIDGAHKCKYVMQDLCWARLLRKGGLLCLDDYAQQTRGVAIAADRFLKKHQNYLKVALVGKLLVIRKSESSFGPEVTWLDHAYATLITPLLQVVHSLDKRIRSLRANPQ